MGDDNTSSSNLQSVPRRRITRVGDAAEDGETLSNLNGSAEPPSYFPDSKDVSTQDWYVEGPGRRVAYDDLTAIDWIFEYAKERQRLRALYSNSTGFFGYLVQIADASQIGGSSSLQEC